MPSAEFVQPDTFIKPQNVHSLQDQILKRPRVQELTSLPVSTLYAWIKDGRFPAPVRLGLRSVGWRLSDIQNWLDSRVSTQINVGGRNG